MWVFGRLVDSQLRAGGVVGVGIEFSFATLYTCYSSDVTIPYHAYAGNDIREEKRCNPKVIINRDTTASCTF